MKVAVGRAQIETVTTDRQEGVWVGTGPRVFHVSPSGAVSRLPLSLPGPGKYTSMTVDRQGNLWLAVERGFEQLTRELIEHSPDGQVRTFRRSARIENCVPRGDST
jgi:ligand-binding sensor domain-containing protein